MATQDNAGIARIPYDAYNNRRFDDAAAVTADDAEFLSVPTGERYRGPDGVRQYLQHWADAFPESKVEVRNVLATDTGAVVEFVGRGTHTGTLRTSMGDIPPTNRQVEVPFCDVYEIRNGKITAARSYFDLATMLRQLGLMPEGVRAPEAAPTTTYTR